MGWVDDLAELPFAIKYVLVLFAFETFSWSLLKIPFGPYTIDLSVKGILIDPLLYILNEGFKFVFHINFGLSFILIKNIFWAGALVLFIIYVLGAFPYLTQRK